MSTVLGEISISGDAISYLNSLDTIIVDGKLPPLRVQPVGYPFFLSLFHVSLSGPNVAVIEFIQELMDVILIGILTYLAYRATKQLRYLPRAILLTIIILQPFTSTMAHSLYTEQSTMFFSFVGALLICRPTSRYNLASTATGGLMLGLAGIMRIDLLILNLTFVFGLMMIVLPWYRSVTSSKRTVTLVTVLIFPICLLGWQHLSTGETGFVVKKFHYEGYMSWLRTWKADRSDYEKFAFFQDDKTLGKALQIDSYPRKSFSGERERQAVKELVRKWSVNGYNSDLNSEWKTIAHDKAKSMPFTYYVTNPLFRMTHFWINTDGAQFYLSKVSFKPPLSTMVVAIIMVFKLVLICMFLVGSYGLFSRRSALLDGSSDALEVLALASFCYVILRTLELGALSVFAWGGLMEIRYIIVAYPFLILVGIYGARYVTKSKILRISE